MTPKLVGPNFICADKIFKSVSGNFFKINVSRDILTFGGFMVP